LPDFLFEGNERHFKKLKNIVLHYIPQWKKPLPLYPTVEENLFHCIPERRKTSSIVSYNGGKPLPMYPTTEENLFHFGIQRKKSCCVVGYNAKGFSVLWETVHHIRFCCGLGYNGRKLLHCRVQQKKNTSIISHYGRKTPVLWDTTEKICEPS
jgi:hypothetical protein